MNHLNNWIKTHLKVIAVALGAIVAICVIAFLSFLDTGNNDLVSPNTLKPTSSQLDHVAEISPRENKPNHSESKATTERSSEATENSTNSHNPPERPKQVISPLPEFNQDSLIYGGTGIEGAILSGTGIVPSSRFQDRTDWEILIPTAKIHASIVGVGLTATKAFGAPDNPHVRGWWKDGPSPGQRGNVLLNGHRDYSDINGKIGTGVAWLLPSTTVGDFLIIRDNKARRYFIYKVTETASVGWDAADGIDYMLPSKKPILTLITCEGSFDVEAHNYSDRRIVVAEMTDSIPITT